jgi:hypothetical protein
MSHAYAMTKVYSSWSNRTDSTNKSRPTFGLCLLAFSWRDLEFWMLPFGEIEAILDYKVAREKYI